MERIRPSGCQIVAPYCCCDVIHASRICGTTHLFQKTATLTPNFLPKYPLLVRRCVRGHTQDQLLEDTVSRLPQREMEGCLFKTLQRMRNKKMLGGFQHRGGLLTVSRSRRRLEWIFWLKTWC